MAKQSLLRFPDLKARKIVGNRTTLLRWQRDLGFPVGIKLGPRIRAWPEDEVYDWIERRRAADEAA